MVTQEPYISCVSTLFRSEQFVPEFVRRATQALTSISQNYELILVDDGSPDGSLAVATAMIAHYPALKVIELSRNFGHHAAILAGLAASRGELVFLVDSDLEEPPELLAEFHEKIETAKDIDVVFGYQNRGNQKLLRSLTSGAFWYLIGKISDVPIHPNMANVRLMRRVYVDALLSMPDQNIFLGGMFAWPGFRQLPVQIYRSPRSQTSYSWRKRFQLAARAAISFSDRPLLAVFGIGMVITSISFAIGVALFFMRLLHPAAVLAGYTSLMLSIWFIGGIMLGCTGVLGFYIAHIYNQARGRPRYFIRARHEGGERK